jgi:acetyl esterase/lipase
MFEFMFQIVDVLKSKGKNAAVLMLSYGTSSPVTSMCPTRQINKKNTDLAPGAVYPRQLQQASALLNHVLTKLEIPPKNIILTGDSAGANLALSLLSHISHPHPPTPLPIPPVNLSSPLRGCVLISPWVSFSTSASSFTAYAYKDCLDPRALKQWSNAFMGEEYPYPSVTDYYNQAITAPESWWEGLQVEEVLVVAGEEEVLVDGIKEFEGKLRRGVGDATKVELLVAKGEYHDQPNLDLQFGYKEEQEGEQAKRIKGWVSSKL